MNMSRLDENENEQEEKEKDMERVKKRIERMSMIRTVLVVGGATRTMFHC